VLNLRDTTLSGTVQPFKSHAKCESVIFLIFLPSSNNRPTHNEAKEAGGSISQFSNVPILVIVLIIRFEKPFLFNVPAVKMVVF
jgi:hypothetical protein